MSLWQMRAWQIHEPERQGEGTQLGGEAGEGGRTRPCEASPITPRDLSLSSEQWKADERL